MVGEKGFNPPLWLHGYAGRIFEKYQKKYKKKLLQIPMLRNINITIEYKILNPMLLPITIPLLTIGMSGFTKKYGRLKSPSSRYYH